MANDVPKAGGYNLDFDKFDDPNFNPFETKTKVVEVALPSNEKTIEAGTPEKSPEESSPLKLQPETDVTKRKHILPSVRRLCCFFGMTQMVISPPTHLN